MLISVVLNTGEAVESLSAEADKRFVCVCVLKELVCYLEVRY